MDIFPSRHKRHYPNRHHGHFSEQTKRTLSKQTPWIFFQADTRDTVLADILDKKWTIEIVRVDIPNCDSSGLIQTAKKIARMLLVGIKKFIMIIYLVRYYTPYCMYNVHGSI